MMSSVPLVLLLLFSLTSAEPHIRVFNLWAADLPANLLGITDGYVKVFLNGNFLGQTSVIWNQVNPRWDEEFEYFGAVETDVLRVEVHDADFLFDDLVGACQGQIQNGSHQRECVLQDGGNLHFSYRLSGTQGLDPKTGV